MAMNEDESQKQQSGESGEDLTESEEQGGQRKGIGVSPGHAGEAHIGDQPADTGQTPPN